MNIKGYIYENTMIYTTMFCVWLIPAMPFHTMLQAHINELVTTYAAPSFEPHVTLFCGETNDIEKTKVSLEALLKNQPKIALTAGSLEASDKWYKTLYVQFKSNAIITKLNEVVKTKLDPNSDYELNPHLSLLYKNIPLDQKRKLTEEVWPKVLDYIPANKILNFDTIKLMTDTDKEGPDAVKSWKLLQSYHLGGPAEPDPS